MMPLPSMYLILLNISLILYFYDGCSGSTTPVTTTPTTPSTGTPSTTTTTGGSPIITTPTGGTLGGGINNGINNGLGPSGAGSYNDMSHGGISMLRNTLIPSITLVISGLAALWLEQEE